MELKRIRNILIVLGIIAFFWVRKFALEFTELLGIAPESHLFTVVFYSALLVFSVVAIWLYSDEIKKLFRRD